MNRRVLLASAVVIAAPALGGASSCSTTTLDPATIAAAIKVACGIAVPASAVLEVINASVGATASMIISLVCSSYKNAAAAQAAGGKLAAGPVNFVVHVCDASGTSCKDIPIVAQTQ